MFAITQGNESRSILTHVRSSKRDRAGFTLMELLIVITIIGILIALLVPAIGGIRQKAWIAKVHGEFNAIEAAIARFKTDFGTEPPSRITLYKTEAEWTANPRDRELIRKLWKDFDFSDAAGTAWSASLTGSGPWNLDGAECLVFFLGGVSDPTNTFPNGFSKNPEKPFDQAGKNRVGPYYDFVQSRIVDLDGDQFPEYVDALPSQSNPILYFSSNDGKGYAYDGTVTPWASRDCWNVGGMNRIRRAYYSKVDTTGATQSDQAANSTPYNAKGYQLISPGADGNYGTGGYFTPNDSGWITAGREKESDNITSFQSGTLGNQ